MYKALIFDFGRTIYDKDNNCLFPKITEVFEYCRTNGYKLFMISNYETGREEIIRDSGVRKYFDKIVVTKGKNKKDFLRCISGVGLEPKDVLVVGDRIKSEIRIGNELGADTVWFKHGKYSGVKPENYAEKPTHTIIRLQQLFDILTSDESGISVEME